MASWLTHDIPDGLSFRDFAIRCLSHQFRGRPVPTEVKVSSFHVDGIKRAEADLKKAEAMTLGEAAAVCEARYTERLAEWEKDVAKTTKVIEAFRQMRGAIAEWDSPSEGLKVFMAAQIESSIEAEHIPEKPERCGAGVYLDREIERAKRALDYHKKSLAKATQDAAQQTATLKAFWASLPPEGETS